MPLDSIGIDTAIETMNIDSLDVLRVAASLEKTFKIRISTDELLGLRTVGDIVTGLDRKLTALESADLRHPTDPSHRTGNDEVF